MRRSLAEPNSLRATPPIIASSFQMGAAPQASVPAQFPAVSANPTAGKCGAIGACAGRHGAPGYRPRHRRGSFSCQCKAALHALVKTAPRIRHCQAQMIRRVSAAEFAFARRPLCLPRNAFMAGTRLLVCCALGALVIAALLMPPIAAPRAEDAEQVVARANGVDIRQSDLAYAEEEIGTNMPNMPPQQKRDYLITYLADVVVLSQSAEQQKLGERPEVKRRLAFDRNRLLMEALLQDAGKASLSDEAEHKVYEEAIKQMASEEEVHARHILLPTEDEAKAVLAELKKGADFAALAKEK